MASKATPIPESAPVSSAHDTPTSSSQDQSVGTISSFITETRNHNAVDLEEESAEAVEARLDLVSVLTNYGNPRGCLTDDEYLKVTKFLNNDELWGSFWDQFVNGYLVPQRMSPTDRSTTIKFRRMWRLWFDKNERFARGWHVYLHANSATERSRWNQEDWLAWLVLRVYLANKGTNGIFAGLDDDFYTLKMSLNRVWLLVLRQRTKWRTLNPHAHVEKNSEFQKLFAKERKEKTAEAKARAKQLKERVEMGVNENGGQITMIWSNGDPEPPTLTINDLNRKTYKFTLEIFTNKMNISPQALLNADVDVDEPASLIIDRYKASKVSNKPFDIDLFRKSVTNLGKLDWPQFQKRAVDSVKPIIVRFTPQKLEDNLIVRALLDASKKRKLTQVDEDLSEINAANVRSPSHDLDENDRDGDGSDEGFVSAAFPDQVVDLNGTSLRADDSNGASNPPAKRARRSAKFIAMLDEDWFENDERGSDYIGSEDESADEDHEREHETESSSPPENLENGLSATSGPHDRRRRALHQQ